MTLSQLKKKVRKEFDREFKDFFGIKEDFLIMCDMDPKDIRDFLDTQIDKTYNQTLEDVEKIVPKKKIMEELPDYMVDRFIGYNQAIDTITSGLKKLKINNLVH